jgi:hypothetical protein
MSIVLRFYHGMMNLETLVDPQENAGADAKVRMREDAYFLLFLFRFA